MEKMDIHSRNEYLKVIRGRYDKVKSKKTKPPGVNLKSIGSRH